MDETPKEKQVVFPTEGEILNAILTQYKEQLDEANKKAVESIEKVKKNLRQLEDSHIAAIAQRKLIEQLEKDMKSGASKQM